MNTTIMVKPEDLYIEKILLRKILHAAKVVGEIYNVCNAELSVTLTDNVNIRALNKKFREIDEETDVLSFAFRESEEPKIFGTDFEILGEIIISLEKAKSQAIIFGHSFQREIIFLEVHGLLHLLGYDHIEESERLEMESEQRFIMSRLGIER